MKKAICLYLHVHQPFRVKQYSIFDVSKDHEYFNDFDPEGRTNNQRIINKVAKKTYLPTNKMLMDLISKYPNFNLNLSISGMALEQFELWAPQVLDSFKELIDTKRVEIVTETYHHSLAFFYSLPEFEKQVALHRQKIGELFGQSPKVIRNTELSYNNDLAKWADSAGYKGIMAEGWDPILNWRSPNFVYRPVGTQNIKLMLKNYRLSDDIAFRFGDRNWKEWPLTADKFVSWVEAGGDSDQVCNLFMDYETFGEHQWAESGIFDFFRAFVNQWLQDNDNNCFMNISEAIDTFEPKDVIDVPNTLTWADTERDLSAWVGNSMQQQAIKAIYSLQEPVMQSNDQQLIDDWRKMQTSDHFYYMCTKWFNDGDIHAYFNPYATPYEAFISYMNAWHDLKYRLITKGFDL